MIKYDHASDKVQKQELYHRLKVGLDNPDSKPILFCSDLCLIHLKTKI